MRIKGSMNPFTPDRVNSRIDKFSKITNWRKLKKRKTNSTTVKDCSTDGHTVLIKTSGKPVEVNAEGAGWLVGCVLAGLREIEVGGCLLGRLFDFAGFSKLRNLWWTVEEVLIVVWLRNSTVVGFLGDSEFNFVFSMMTNCPESISSS